MGPAGGPGDTAGRQQRREVVRCRITALHSQMRDAKKRAGSRDLRSNTLRAHPDEDRGGGSNLIARALRSPLLYVRKAFPLSSYQPSWCVDKTFCCFFVSSVLRIPCLLLFYVSPVSC